MTTLTVTSWFILALLAGSAAGLLAPRLIPEQDEMVVQAGDKFTLRCESHLAINWSYPIYQDNRSTSLLNVSYGETGDPEYPHVSNLQVTDAYFMDTGFYYCTEEGEVSLTSNDRVSRIFVYVNDSLNLLIRDETFLIGYEHRLTVLPCRPTSPDVKVTLKNDDGEILDVEFDPHQGFIIQVTHVIDSRSYECVANRGDLSETLDFHLNVIPSTDSVPTPEVRLLTADHVVEGTTFRLNCSVSVEADVRYRLTWQTPNDESKWSRRLEEGNTSVVLMTYDGRSMQTGYRVLTVHNASSADNGDYTCTIIDHNGKRNNQDFSLTVYNKDVAYIKIVRDDSDKMTIHKQVGDADVKWVIEFKSHPPSKIIWRDPKNKILSKDMGRSDVDVNSSNSSTQLIVKDITLDKAGDYTLTISNGKDIVRITKKLEVTGPPDVQEVYEVGGAPFFYEWEQNYMIRCQILANPPAKIEWQFESCVSYTNCSNKETLNGSRSESTVGYELTSNISQSTKASGRVTCVANNSGSEKSSKTLAFFVADVTDGFGIIKPAETVERHEMVLTCRASKYNYSSIIEWTKDGKPLTPDFNVKSGSTKFSHESSLTVRKLAKSHAGNYTCFAMTMRGHTEGVTELVTVSRVVLPKVNSNLNGSELVLKQLTPLDLRCDATGTPRPSVVWYKDDKPIVIAPTDNTRHMSDYELKIKFIKVEDEGRYSCRATSSAGSDENFVIVKVDGKTSLSGGIIAVIVILLLTVVVVLVILFFKFRQQKRLLDELKSVGLNHFEQGAAESINPELGVDEQAELLPYDRKWEFPRDKLKLGKQLGSGAFGVVMKAEAIGILAGEPISTVAVKMVKRNADSTYIKALASELKIMVHLGQHLNVVNLLGACTKNLMKRELLVIVEFCCFGNLQNYLLRHRQNFIDQVVGDAIDPTKGAELVARAIAEDRKAREAHEESTRVNYTALAFENSDGCSSPPMSPMSPLPPEMSARHASVSSNPSTYQWNTANTFSTDASGQNSGTVEDSQPAWRSNYRGDYNRRADLHPLRTQDLLCWAFQVARGMDYLVSRRVLHGDLAARNILLAEDNVVKICDFGLAKSMYKSDNYKKKGDGPLPVKWMAIESIQDRVFSTQSDVWSFGIVLWEFFSLARTPYPGMEADEKLFSRLMDGYRMEKPKYATNTLYSVMQECWHGEPGRRPTFLELSERLGGMLEESVRVHYMDLNTPYVKTLGEGVVEDYLAMMCAPTYCNEVARQRTPFNDYVNVPSPSGGVDSTDYLQMSPTKNGPENSPLTEEEGYLRMNIGSPTRSVLFSPQTQPAAFQFPNSARLSFSEKQGAEQAELRPMLHGPGYSPPREDFPAKSPTYTNLPASHDDRFGDGLKSSPLSPSFDNPSYQILSGLQDVSRKRGYSEASSSGFHSERDSNGHSPKQSEDDSRASPPHYNEATAMASSVLV